MTDYKELCAALREETEDRIREAADVIERLQRERDAAVTDLKVFHWCNFCKYCDLTYGEEPCRSCTSGGNEWERTNNWEWIGVQDE